MSHLIVGKIYRLRWPGIAARVLPNPPETSVTMSDGTRGYLVESIFTKSRWWVNAAGKPNNHRSPWMIVSSTSDQIQSTTEQSDSK